VSQATPIPSPVDAFPVPERLTARVVSPDERPRLHGFDVHEDLACYYTPTETLLLTLTGELPDLRQARMAEIALIFASPVRVCEAPSHAAVIARMLGGRSSGVLSLAATVLAEQLRTILGQHAGVTTWLRGGAVGSPPQADCAADDSTRSQVERLRSALRRSSAYPQPLDAPLAMWPAILTVLFCSGLTEPWQIEAALASCRLPVVLAEAMAVEPGSFRDYPIRLPEFAYQHERAGSGQR
jgi:hypothetical protein